MPKGRGLSHREAGLAIPTYVWHRMGVFAEVWSVDWVGVGCELALATAPAEKKYQTTEDDDACSDPSSNCTDVGAFGWSGDHSRGGAGRAA